MEKDVTSIYLALLRWLAKDARAGDRVRLCVALDAQRLRADTHKHIRTGPGTHTGGS
jgi:hypothetical protein